MALKSFISPLDKTFLKSEQDIEGIGQAQNLSSQGENQYLGQKKEYPFR
jgi:hypothetical protein